MSDQKDDTEGTVEALETLMAGPTSNENDIMAVKPHKSRFRTPQAPRTPVWVVDPDRNLDLVIKGKEFKAGDECDEETIVAIVADKDYGRQLFHHYVSEKRLVRR